MILIVAALTAFSSCVNTVRELSTYWDGHDFSSLEAFDDIDAAEDRFDGYIDLLSRVPHDVAAKNMTEFLDSAARDTVAYMVWATWFEPYLHSPSSPYRNDALFEVWLTKTLEDKVVDDYMLDRLRKIRNVMRLNMVGQTAADVLLTDADEVEFRISDMKGKRTLLMLLDANGICASSGSACTSGSLDPSHVLLAIGLPHEIAHGSLRLSLSEETTMEEADKTVDALKVIIPRLRSMSPLYEDFVRNNK